jgi:hypothetical protein
VNRAREIKTAFASVLFGPRAIASDPIARKNLTVLEYNGGQGRYHHIPNSPPLYDFGLLQRLQVCHLRHAPFVKEIILPKSVTELTLPISCRANYGELTSLVKLKLMVMDGGTPYSLNQPPQPKNVAPTFTWPPSLSSLEIDTSPHAYPNDDFTKLFPPTLTHLGYTGEASALIDMVRAIPPQCTALESIHFENAHFERRDYNVGLLFPSSLRSLNISWLQAADDDDFDHFVNALPPTLTRFGVVTLRLDYAHYEVPPNISQRAKLMERMDLMSLQRFVADFINDVGDDYPTHDADKKAFIELAKDVLARRYKIDYEPYAYELVHLSKTRIGPAVASLPRQLVDQFLATAKQVFGKHIGHCGVIDGQDQSVLDSAHYVFRHIPGAKRLTLDFLADVPPTLKGDLFNADVAAKLERITFCDVNHWFDEFFSGNLVFPRLKRIIFIYIDYQKAIDALVSAKHSFPRLEKVKFSSFLREPLKNVEQIKSLASMRLYGFTLTGSPSTWLTYRPTQPWFYPLQLKGETIDPILHCWDGIDGGGGDDDHADDNGASSLAM